MYLFSLGVCFQLHLTVHNVPDLTAGVICSFESLGESEGQLQLDGEVRCLSPTLRDEPPGENGECLEREMNLQMESLVQYRGSKRLGESRCFQMHCFLKILRRP